MIQNPKYLASSDPKYSNAGSEKAQGEDTPLTVFIDPPVNPASSQILNKLMKRISTFDTDSEHHDNKYIQDINLNETLAMMEKQLSNCIEKGTLILQESKGLNYSQKMNLMYKNDEGGMYILSQKNLIKNMDNLKQLVHRKTEHSISQDWNDDNVKIEEDETLKVETDCNPIKEEISENPSKIVVAETEWKSSKPVVGFRKLAGLTSRLYGSDNIKKRIKKEAEKQFDDLCSFILSDDNKDTELSNL